MAQGQCTHAKCCSHCTTHTIYTPQHQHTDSPIYLNSGVAVTLLVLSLGCKLCITSMTCQNMQQLPHQLRLITSMSSSCFILHQICFHKCNIHCSHYRQIPCRIQSISMVSQPLCKFDNISQSIVGILNGLLS